VWTDVAVAADTAGHTMRAVDGLPPGPVIGKAVDKLARGTGMVQMLVMLQWQTHLVDGCTGEQSRPCQSVRSTIWLVWRGRGLSHGDR
jgi:hypothetical protein